MKDLEKERKNRQREKESERVLINAVDCTVMMELDLARVGYVFILNISLFSRVVSGLLRSRLC